MRHDSRQRHPRKHGKSVITADPPVTSTPLLDRGNQSGSRSLWLRPATSELPYYLRYELLVGIGGQPVLFGDDPRRSALAADDPQCIVYLRMQGAQIDDFTSEVMPATQGPSRHRLAPGGNSLNRDHAEAVRVDLVLSLSATPFTVCELRIYWRTALFVKIRLRTPRPRPLPALRNTFCPQPHCRKNALRNLSADALAGSRSGLHE